MVNQVPIQNEFLYKRMRELGNKQKFKVVELTQNNEMSITDINKHPKLKYKRCSEYIHKLEKLGVVSKRKEGKNVFVKGKIVIKPNKIEFN